MKKTILIFTITSSIASSMLFADALTGVVKDAVVASVKTEVINQVEKAIETNATETNATSALTSGGSMTDKVVDVAVEKTIGDNAIAKDIAKKAVNAVIK